MFNPHKIVFNLARARERPSSCVPDGDMTSCVHDFMVTDSSGRLAWVHNIPSE